MKTADKQFQYSHVTHPRQMCGTMTPFRPHWAAQHLPSGEQETFNSRQGVFQWVKGWYDIGNTPKPAWLLKETKKTKSK